MFCAAPGFFPQTLELGRQTYLGRCAHSINEKNPAEMIDLVLNRPRQKAGRFDLDRLPSKFWAHTVIDFARTISPVISGKLKQPSVPFSVSAPKSICGLIKTSGIAIFGSMLSPFNFIVLGRSSTSETSSTVI